MTRRHYDIGQIVFAEGDESDFVGYIVEGEAEVSRRHGDDIVIIGQLSPGDYCGEMAAIEEGVHEATVRATGALTLDCIGRSDFLRHASGDSDLAFRLLQRLSQRLQRLDDAYAAAVSANRQMSARTGESRPSAAPHSEVRVPLIRLSPGSDRLAAYLPADGLVPVNLPFIVGRKPSFHERCPNQRVDLLIEDPKPYRLSRLHFEIFGHDGRVEVRDLNSHLGTVVNGTAVGRFFSRDAAELKMGENKVVAGGRDSPYIFRVTVVA